MKEVWLVRKNLRHCLNRSRVTSVVGGSFNALSLVKVEGAALHPCLSPGVTVGKETTDKTLEEFEQTEAVSSEQKEKTCTYRCPAVEKGQWCLCPLQSLPNFDCPTLRLSCSVSELLFFSPDPDLHPFSSQTRSGAAFIKRFPRWKPDSARMANSNPKPGSFSSLFYNSINKETCLKNF